MENPKWCEHRGMVEDGTGEYYSDKNWMFCPICGTPRPVSKTLEEKVAESIYQQTLCCPTPNAWGQIDHATWAAKAAITAVREWAKEHQ